VGRELAGEETGDCLGDWVWVPLAEEVTEGGQAGTSFGSSVAVEIRWWRAAVHKSEGSVESAETIRWGSVLFVSTKKASKICSYRKQKFVPAFVYA